MSFYTALYLNLVISLYQNERAINTLCQLHVTLIGSQFLVPRETCIDAEKAAHDLRGSNLQLGFTTVPNEKPTALALVTNPSTPDIANTASESEASHEKTMRDLHTLLLETEVREGKMVCGNCRHEYRIKEGIANFLLPSHLGEFPRHLAPYS